MPMESRGWWQTRGYMAAALVLAAAPFLWPSVPPLLDLPGHMGSYHAALNLDDTPLRRFYTFQWQLIGNLGVDLAMLPAGYLLGVELGAKIVVIAIPVLTVAGLLLIAHEAHGRLPATTAFALPLAYCYPLFFGFVNYCLAMALACLAFGLWLRLSRLGLDRARFALFLLIAPMIWVAHAIGWVILCVLCGAAELHPQLGRRNGVLPALFSTGVACLALLSPLALMAMAPLGTGDTVTGWLNPQEIAKWTLALLRDRWIAFDLLCTVALGVVLALAATRRFGARIAPALGWPALALIILYVLTPKSINGSDFVGARIVPYAAAILLLAIDTSNCTRRQVQGWAMLASLFLLVRIGGNTLSALTYDREWSERLVALDHVPRGAAIATFTPWRCQPGLSNWTNSRIDHLSGMAIVRRDAFVNSEWTLHGLHLLRVRYSPAGDFRSDPSQYVTAEPCGYTYLPPFARALATLPRGAFDYVWLVGMPKRYWPRQDWLEPVWSADDTALYRIVRPAGSSRPAATS